MDEDISPDIIWECAEQFGGCGHREFEKEPTVIRLDQPLYLVMGQPVGNLTGLARLELA
jgi:hypothetical protein